MAKKAIKETKYCSLISQSIIADEEYTYALEKIIVKPQGNREELRFSVYKDQQRYGMKLLVRPLDLQEELFLQLLKKALEDNLFSKKFITQLKKLINEKIDLPLQLFLWSLIDNLEIEKDYLQVFNLNRVGDVINIEHTQEVPEYKSFIKVNAKDLEFKEEIKIYVIDSGVYSTMLLSEEY